jgi:hypothetical protein
MIIMEQPPLLTRAQAVELTGLGGAYLDKLRKSGVVRVYTMLGGRQHRFYRDDLMKHLGLGEQRNGKH